MNDELKEIIELINTKYEDYYIDDFLSGEDVKKLADYITDLQQENENLKEHLKAYKKDSDETQDRIDKAIEYIEWQKENPQYDNVWRKWECESLINILKGDNDD